MNWMFLPLQRYADFQGRSRRMEYWMFTLGIAILYAIFFVVGAMVGVWGRADANSTQSVGAIVLLLVLVVIFLGVLIPALAVQVRRFHDQDKSGWFVLIGFIPYVGGLIVLVFMCLPGTKGSNRFGHDPLDPDGVRDLSDVFG